MATWPDAVNERFHALFREYAVVGGMPAVASAFLERGHYGEVQSLLEAIENGDGVVPVEVKATAGRSRSLDRLLGEASVPYGVKLTGGNVGVSDKKVTLPHYMGVVNKRT